MSLPGTIDLAAVNAMAPGVAIAIRAKANETKGKEAQFVAEMDELLGAAVRKAGLFWDTDSRKAERRVAWPGVEGLQYGRIDRLLFNRVVIEYEPPGSLTHSNAGTKNRHAITQAKDYMSGLIHHEGQKADSIAGVVTDGFYFIYCRFSAGQWVEEAPLPCDQFSVGRLLRLLLTFRKEALLPDTVVERFGEANDHTAQLVKELYRALKKPKEPLTAALYAQWLDFFSDIAGLDPKELSSKKSLMEFARRVTMDRNPDPAKLLFALYTYSAIIVKLLTVLAVLPFVDPDKADSIEKWSQFNVESLLDEFRRIESGEYFARHVTNFTEGDFFGWYTGEWTEGIYRRLLSTINTLAQYDTDAVEQAPERVQDLLKSLYHGLFPKDVRHDLGEYYTPDWLAERLLEKIDPNLFPQFPPDTAPANRAAAADLIRDKLTTTSFLDPSCGSGTFLVLIIRRLRQWARECGLDERRDLLPALFQNIRGFDLNPLAVISSRANFLLAIADLLRDDDEPAEMPIYIADSIVMPAKSEALLEKDYYQIPLRGLNAGKEKQVILKIPVGITAIPGGLRQLTELLTKAVPQELPAEAFLRTYAKTMQLNPTGMRLYESVLRELYETLLQLHREKRNGIWANIVRNMFMPVLMPQVEYVVGNPPWVNWESLPAHYRESSKKAWEKYGLFVHGGMDTILGKGKKDVSMLLTYVASDIYLNPGGRLGFVITQSVFKSSGAGQGFRRFVLPDGIDLKLLLVEDFSSFQPFESATNRTATFVLEKGQATQYPVRYNLVRKLGRAKIPYRVALERVAHLMADTVLYAEPVDSKNLTSSWICAGKRALTALKKLRAPSAYRAYAGAYSGGANAVYWLRILKHNRDGTVRVQNITEGAKRAVKQEEHDVEPSYLYPLLRGRDVSKWRAVPEPGANFLIVQDPEKRRGIAEEDLMNAAPKTLSYLRKYKPMLEERAAYKRYFDGRAEFYSMFNISGNYTFSEYKVVWAEQGDFECAVVHATDKKLVIPDHKLMLIPCEDAAEAHYICALANSQPFQLAVRAYTIETQQDTHIFQNVNVPKFKSSDRTHKKLAELSQRAHELVAAGAGENLLGLELQNELGKIEAEIDKQAAKLWELDEDELADIHQNLADLA